MGRGRREGETETIRVHVYHFVNLPKNSFFHRYYFFLQNSLIVAYTSHNHGNPQTGGIKTPNRGRLTVSNVTFVNFDLANSACLRACSHCKVFQGGFQVWFQRMQFYNSPNKAFFQWEHEVCLASWLQVYS